jgi:hypothetical protein
MASVSIMLRHLGRKDLGWVAADRGVILPPATRGGRPQAFQMAHAQSSVKKPRALLDTLKPPKGWSCT